MDTFSTSLLDALGDIDMTNEGDLDMSDLNEELYKLINKPSVQKRRSERQKNEVFSYNSSKIEKVQKLAQRYASNTKQLRKTQAANPINWDSEIKDMKKRIKYASLLSSIVNLSDEEYVQNYIQEKSEKFSTYFKLYETLGEKTFLAIKLFTENPEIEEFFFEAIANIKNNSATEAVKADKAAATEAAVKAAAEAVKAATEAAVKAAAEAAVKAAAVKAAATKAAAAIESTTLDSIILALFPRFGHLSTTITKKHLDNIGVLIGTLLKMENFSKMDVDCAPCQRGGNSHKKIIWRLHKKYCETM